MPRPLSKKTIDTLKRHGQMWQVQTRNHMGRMMVAVQLLDGDLVFIQPSVADALGRALIGAAIEAIGDDPTGV